MTPEEIKEALKRSEELQKAVVPFLAELEPVKVLINNKSNAIYNERIKEEISKVHKKYDEDMFEILGIRCGTAEDGTKEKTYNKIKSIYKEYKELKEKGTFTKDEKVRDLEAKLKDALEKTSSTEEVKKIQEVFDQAKKDWFAKEEKYKQDIKNLNDNGLRFEKQTEINNAISQLRFNPDTPESIKKMVIDSVRRELIDSSKKQDDKILFLNEEGKTRLNSKYEPMTALEVLNSLEAIKDISLKEENTKGGGAHQNINAHVGNVNVNVEGKDVTLKKLNIAKNSIKSKSHFIEVSEKALLDAGITRRDPNFDRMKTEAYIELGVANLPID